MESSNLNIMYHKSNYCAAMMVISTLQTDGKEREATNYVRSKEFVCV